MKNKLVLYLILCIDMAQAGPFAYKKYVHYDFKSDLIQADSKSSDYGTNTYSRVEYTNRYDHNSKCQFFVKHGCGHHKIEKPFVFVEGISFDNKTWTNNNYSFSDYFHLTVVSGGNIKKNAQGVEMKWENFPEMMETFNTIPSNLDNNCPIGYSTFNWGTLVSGVEVEGLMEGDPLRVQKCPELLNKLYDSGYDIIFVDFESGENFIENNGYALAKVLRIIKDSLDNNGSTEKEVVCGASMGGLVSRFAIKELELNGGPTYDHCVSKFISFDSPQMGANIHLGLQYLLQDFKFLDGSLLAGFDEVSENFSRYDKLTCPSASQLVLYSCLNNKLNTLLPVDYSNANQSSERAAFLNNPNIANWPVNCKLYAIMNGSRKGNAQNNGSFSDCNLIADVDGLIDIEMKSLPKDNDGYCKIFQVIPAATLYGIPVAGLDLAVLSKIMYVKNSKAIDMVAGSYRSDLQSITSINSKLNTALGLILNGGYSIPSVFNGYTTNAPNYCFIPSLSAAGVKNFNSKVENSHTELSNLFVDSYKFSDPSHQNSYFDVVYGPEQNQSHVEITDENIAWVMEILHDCEGTVLLFQNETISNDVHTSCGYIKAGADVGKGNGIGNAVVAANTNVAYKAVDFISLEPGFMVEPGATFEASILTVDNCVSGNRLANTSSHSGNHQVIEAQSPQSMAVADASIQLNASNHAMLVTPNPTNNNCILSYKLNKASMVSVQIHNAYGAEFFSIPTFLSSSAGQQTLELPTAQLPQGVYVITLQSADGRFSKRLIKE